MNFIDFINEWFSEALFSDVVCLKMLTQAYYRVRETFIVMPKSWVTVG